MPQLRLPGMARSRSRASVTGSTYCSRWGCVWLVSYIKLSCVQTTKKKFSHAVTEMKNKLDRTEQKINLRTGFFLQQLPSHRMQTLNTPLNLTLTLRPSLPAIGAGTWVA